MMLFRFSENKPACVPAEERKLGMIWCMVRIHVPRSRLCSKTMYRACIHHEHHCLPASRLLIHCSKLPGLHRMVLFPLHSTLVPSSGVGHEWPSIARNSMASTPPLSMGVHSG